MDKIFIALLIVGFLSVSGCEGDKFSFSGQNIETNTEVEGSGTEIEEDEDSSENAGSEGNGETGDEDSTPELNTPASIVFTEQADAEVLNESYNLTGRIIGGSAPITLVTINFEDENYVVNLRSNGFFSQNFILKAGRNVFVINVLTNDGETVSQQFTVHFQPVFIIQKVSPAAGYISKESTVIFSFEIKTNGLQPTVLLNKAPVNLTKISDQLYSYVAELSLLPGENNIEIKAIAYNKEKTQALRYYYQPEGLAAPVINVLSPRTNQQTRHASMPIYFDVLSEYGVAQVTVAQKEVSFQKTNGGAQVSAITELQEGENSVILWAKDTFGQEVTQELALTRSSQKPEIIFDNALLEYPQINEFEQGLINFQGRVVAQSLKSFTVNGQNIKLAVNGDHYTFNHNLLIAANDEYLATFTAIDELGNKTSRSFNLLTENSLYLDWITPKFPLSISAENGTGHPFALKAQGATEQHSFKAKLQPTNTIIALQLLGSTVTGSLPSGLAEGEYSLVIEAYKEGSKLQELKGTINVSSADDIPLQIVQILPSNEGTDIEPDVPLQVNFNRPIKTDEIEIIAKQTLHGLTYINVDEPGVDFLHSQGYELREVNRSNAPVEGGLSFVNKNQTVLFYPKHDLGYGANITWEVRYKNQAISNQMFKTRSLPTFVEGGIIDVDNELAQNISVEIEELGLTTKTNADGSYNFGYGLPADKNIPDGTYHLLVNKSDEATSYGSLRVAIEITQGILNQLKLIKLPIIDRSIAPISIATNNKRLNLAEGDLLLEIEGAGEFIAAQGKNYLYSNFIIPSKSIRQIQPGLAPMWLYQMYPFGAHAEGGSNVTINLPRYMGGYDYLLGGEYGESYTLILGYNLDKNIIEPVGLGKITGTTLKSVHPIQFSSLDYIGYSPILAEHQDIAEQYAQNKISLSELVARVLADHR